MNGMVLFSSVGWGYERFGIISNEFMSRLIAWVIAPVTNWEVIFWR